MFWISLAICFLCHKYLDLGYGRRRVRETPKNRWCLMWDLKDENKFSSKERARREEQGGRKVHAEKWQAEIAKYKKTTRIGLDYLMQNFVTLKEHSLSCGLVVSKYNSCTRNLLSYLLKCRFLGPPGDRLNQIPWGETWVAELLTRVPGIL